MSVQANVTETWPSVVADQDISLIKYTGSGFSTLYWERMRDVRVRYSREPRPDHGYNWQHLRVMLSGQSCKQNNTKCRDTGRTMLNLLMWGYRCMKSRTLPLPNQGIAKAGIGSVANANDQEGLMFGWLNEAHFSSRSASICNCSK